MSGSWFSLSFQSRLLWLTSSWKVSPFVLDFWAKYQTSSQTSSEDPCSCSTKRSHGRLQRSLWKYLEVVKVIWNRNLNPTLLSLGSIGSYPYLEPACHFLPYGVPSDCLVSRSTSSQPPKNPKKLLWNFNLNRTKHYLLMKVMLVPTVTGSRPVAIAENKERLHPIAVEYTRLPVKCGIIRGNRVEREKRFLKRLELVASCSLLVIFTRCGKWPCFYLPIELS